jgi:hypothetical protein
MARPLTTPLARPILKVSELSVQKLKNHFEIIFPRPKIG